MKYLLPLLMLLSCSSRKHSLKGITNDDFLKNIHPLPGNAIIHHDTTNADTFVISGNIGYPIARDTIIGENDGRATAPLSDTTIKGSTGNVFVCVDSMDGLWGFYIKDNSHRIIFKKLYPPKNRFIKLK